jgi:3-oxoacyl-[acyl-carrier-protein] synthase III
MPTRKVTNDEVLAAIEEESRAHLDGQKGKVLSGLRTLLRLSGTRERRWRAPGERAYDFAKIAVDRALQDADMTPEEIDLVLYVGVGRGWVEPGMATFFMHEFGMTNATGYDILDACLSWLRALHISQQFLRNGVYRNIMVLNAEFNQEYHDWAIRDADEVAFRFAQMTIGESATATILTAEETSIEPFFAFKTDPKRHDLCKIPLPQIASYNDKERCPRLDPLVFFAYSTDLVMAAQEMIPDLYFSTPELQRRRCDICFGHSASQTLINDLARRLGILDRTVNLYSEIGNCVSASIPTAMALSVEQGRLTRGMEMLLIMGSAGFSAGIGHMVY